MTTSRPNGRLLSCVATEVRLELTERSSRPTVFKTAPRPYWGQLRHLLLLTIPSTTE